MKDESAESAAAAAGRWKLRAPSPLELLQGALDAMKLLSSSPFFSMTLVAGPHHHQAITRRVKMRRRSVFEDDEQLQGRMGDKKRGRGPRLLGRRHPLDRRYQVVSVEPLADVDGDPDELITVRLTYERSSPDVSAAAAAAAAAASGSHRWWW